MKRVIVLLLALVMILGLVACGGGGKTTECEVCGKTAKCRSLSYEGETGWFCDDCYDGVKAMLDLIKDYGG